MTSHAGHRLLAVLLAGSFLLDPVYAATPASTAVACPWASVFKTEALMAALVEQRIPLFPELRGAAVQRFRTALASVPSPGHFAEVLGLLFVQITATLATPLSLLARAHKPLLHVTSAHALPHLQNYGLVQVSVDVTKEYVMRVAGPGDWAWRLFKSAKSDPSIAGRVKDLTWEQFKAANASLDLEHLRIGTDLLIPHTSIAEHFTVNGPALMPQVAPDAWQILQPIYPGLELVVGLIVAFAVTATILWLMRRRRKSATTPPSPQPPSSLWQENPHPAAETVPELVHQKQSLPRRLRIAPALLKTFTTAA